MTRMILSKATQWASSSLRSAAGPVRLTPRLSRPVIARLSATPTLAAVMRNCRCLSGTSAHRLGILPDTEDPPPKHSEPSPVTITSGNITDEEYHMLANQCLNMLVDKFEELQDQRSDVSVEFSNDVLTVNIGTQGTYVINKQPPNKQIWLSSTVSGPKRYDWVIMGDGQNDKEGTSTGDWIYLRDGSTLNQLLSDEVGLNVTLSSPFYSG